MFVYELSGRGSETRCCHLNDPCFTDETHASVRSSQGALKIFAKFTGNTCARGVSFLTKFQAFVPSTFLKRDYNIGVSL